MVLVFSSSSSLVSAVLVSKSLLAISNALIFSSLFSASLSSFAISSSFILRVLVFSSSSFLISVVLVSQSLLAISNAFFKVLTSLSFILNLSAILVSNSPRNRIRGGSNLLSPKIPAISFWSPMSSGMVEFNFSNSRKHRNAFLAWTSRSWGASLFWRSDCVRIDGVLNAILRNVYKFS